MSEMKIQFEDGTTYKLCPITFNMFCEYFSWEGANDMAFIQWKRENNYYELSDFNVESLRNAILIYTDTYRERVIKFSLVDDNEGENIV